MFLLGMLVGVIAVLVLAIILSALKVSGGDEDERQKRNAISGGERTVSQADAWSEERPGGI